MRATVRVFATLVLGLVSLQLNSMDGSGLVAQGGSGTTSQDFGEVAPYTGPEVGIESVEAVRCYDTYEIRDDDSVTADHGMYGLPYYTTFTFTGPLDAEWLVIEGNYSYYVVNDNQVVFHNVQDWLRVVFRTNQYVYRTLDQIHFGTYKWTSFPVDYDVNVTYPAQYGVLSATPAGYTIPAPGRIHWSFPGITEYTLYVDFSGLGPDRPLLDLPLDYEGRDEGSAIAFRRAFNGRVTAMFDHQYPNALCGDDEFVQWNGDPDSPVANLRCYNECVVGLSCYDGHNGYDFRARCDADRYPCESPLAVYAAADGVIVSAGSGSFGCQIKIDHGNGWHTLYGHLSGYWSEAEKKWICDQGILHWSGEVTKADQIGIMGHTGVATGDHLHFSVLSDDKWVDPSGWKSVKNDPWAEDEEGTSSYPMWLYSIDTTQAFDPSIGGILTSPTHEAVAVVPPDYYSTLLTFSLSYAPATSAPGELSSTGHSYSLFAMDSLGNRVEQLDQPLTLVIRFQAQDIANMLLDTLGVYSLAQDTGDWTPLSTQINWTTLEATVQTDRLSNFALMGKLPSVVYLPLICR